MQRNKAKTLKNQIFIILVVLRRSVLRVAGPIPAAKRLGNTAAKKCRNGSESLATLCRFDRCGGIELRTPPTASA